MIERESIEDIVENLRVRSTSEKTTVTCAGKTVLVDQSSPFKETVINIARQNNVLRFIVLADGVPIDPRDDIRDFSKFKSVYILKYDKDGI